VLTCAAAPDAAEAALRAALRAAGDAHPEANGSNGSNHPEAGYNLALLLWARGRRMDAATLWMAERGCWPRQTVHGWPSTGVTTPSAPPHGRPGPESRASGAASRPAPAPRSAARCAPRRLTRCGARAVGGARSRTSEGGASPPRPCAPRRAGVGARGNGCAEHTH